MDDQWTSNYVNFQIYISIALSLFPFQFAPIQFRDLTYTDAQFRVAQEVLEPMGVRPIGTQKLRQPLRTGTVATLAAGARKRRAACA